MKATSEQAKSTFVVLEESIGQLRDKGISRALNAATDNLRIAVEGWVSFFETIPVFCNEMVKAIDEVIETRALDTPDFPTPTASALSP